MSVVLLTRTLSLLLFLVTWSLLRYPRIWDGFAWVFQCIWNSTKHIIAALFVGYVSYGVMMKLWYAYPELYVRTDATFNNSIESICGKLYDAGFFLLSLFTTATFEAILLHGFNISTIH